MAYIADKAGNDFKDAGLFQPADNHKKADEEQQGLVIYLFQELDSLRASHNQGDKGNHGSDKRHREPGLGMGHKQHHRTEENQGADGKGHLVGNSFLGIRHGVHVCLGELFSCQFLAEYEEIVDNNKDQADGGNQAGIGNKVCKGIPQGRTDDDVGRISAHRGRAAQVCAENL